MWKTRQRPVDIHVVNIHELREFYEVLQNGSKCMPFSCAIRQLAGDVKTVYWQYGYCVGAASIVHQIHQ